MPVFDDPIAVSKCALCGDGFRGWRVAEDEEFDKDADENHYGNLAEKKTFGERKSVFFSF